MPDPRQRPGRFDALVGGLHATPATVGYGPTLRCINGELSPLGSRALLGVPAGELASRVVGLTEVLGRPGDELVERLSTAATWSRRFAILDKVLARRLTAPVAAPASEVREAWQRLLRTGGHTPVAGIADEVGWSRRHLGERFRAELGLTPKVAARVIRFDRAAHLLERPERPALADVAARCGYSDQAHLTREWRSFAGAPPARWLAAEQLSNVQTAMGSLLA